MGKLVVFVAFVVACVVPAQQQQGPMGPQQQQQQQGGATCEGACTHYLQCKGQGDQNAFNVCVGECNNRQFDQNTLAQYQQTDCATAIQLVENPQQQQGGQQQGGQQQDCQGCVKDGDSCIWMSQSNWGAGPYSGAVSSCAASCCGL